MNSLGKPCLVQPGLEPTHPLRPNKIAAPKLSARLPAGLKLGCPGCDCVASIGSTDHLPIIRGNVNCISSFTIDRPKPTTRPTPTT
jgi:hypothetical protein